VSVSFCRFQGIVRLPATEPGVSSARSSRRVCHVLVMQASKHIFMSRPVQCRWSLYKCYVGTRKGCCSLACLRPNFPGPVPCCCQAQAQRHVQHIHRGPTGSRMQSHWRATCIFHTPIVMASPNRQTSDLTLSGCWMAACADKPQYSSHLIMGPFL
jgi:hypothetical protein